MADASHTASWNRGAYLVNSLGHCAECHSPRNFLGGIVEAQRFAGGPNPEGEGWVPNITQKGGLAEWSAKDIAYFLETGQTPDGDTAGGSMARVIRNTSQLSAGGSRRHGGISEVAAAGRGTAAAEKGKGRREVMTGALRLRYQGVKAAVIGIRLSGAGAARKAARWTTACAAPAWRFLVFFESVARLTAERCR